MEIVCDDDGIGRFIIGCDSLPKPDGTYAEIWKVGELRNGKPHWSSDVGPKSREDAIRLGWTMFGDRKDNN